MKRYCWMRLALRGGLPGGLALLLVLPATLSAQKRDLDDSDWTPLMKAAQQDDWKAALLLIDQGADRNAKAPRTGMTALMIAAWYESAETLDILLFNQADANLSTQTGVTALMIAAGRGNLAMVDSLIDWGAKVDPVDAEGSNALLMAITAGNPEVVSRLIEAGAEVDDQDPMGISPLMWAASKGNAEVVRVLLDAGADPTLRDDEGNTAADVAWLSGHPDLVAMIRDAPARPDPAIGPPPFRSEPPRDDLPDRLADRTEEAPEGWVVHRSPALQIRMALPAPPELALETLDTQLGPAEDASAFVDQDGMSYSVGRTTYPDEALRLDDDAFFAQFLTDSLFEGRHELVQPADRIRYGPLPGRSVRYRSQSERKTFDTWIEVFRDGSTGYLMAVNARQGKLDDDLARAFFRGVWLLNPGPGIETPDTPEPSRLQQFKDMMVTLVDAEGRGDARTIAEGLQQSEGMILFVMGGVYRESLQIDQPIILIGIGDDPSEVVLELPDDTPLLINSSGVFLGNLTVRRADDVASDDPAPLVEITEGRQILEDCVFDTARSNGLVIRGTADPVLRTSDIHGGPFSGVMLIEDSTATLDRCTIQDHESSGIVAADESRLTLRSSELSENAEVGLLVRDEARVQGELLGLLNNGVDNLRLTDSSLGVFRDCIFSQAGEDGAWLASNSRGTFTACTFSKNGQTGLRIQSATRTVLVDSLIAENEQAGLLIEEQSPALLDRCVIRSNAYAGAELSGSSGATFLDCTITENTQSGVFAHSAALGQLVACRLTSNGGSGVSVESGRVDLVDCELSSNARFGLELASDATVASRGCSFENQPGGDHSLAEGARLLRLVAVADDEAVTHQDDANPAPGAVADPEPEPEP
ncbi:right-handed parallel beta-helix repeat-containing protein [Tautonia marina]|uniref:right-handed parallel beta-helix repeat-containing protein n=1 Tax=Tautonia marina TaxID=2653855 RepID=UPI0012607421|nr:right-handed parallel beta-helix repeat-containing protein [Tautonia marina]